jgi:hypothetical protein
VHRRGLPDRVSIVGDRPESGTRLRLALDREGRCYQGTATTSSERWDVRVGVDGAIETAAPKDVSDWASRVVRIAVRDAAADARRPPRTIHRWRA